MEIQLSQSKKEKLKNNNITIIGINYYPEDTAIGLYTTQKAEYLANRGYNVTVITGFPYYPQWEIKKEYKKKGYFLKESLNGVNILRSKQYVPKNPTFIKRIVHLISFTFGGFINLFKTTKPDVVLTIVPFTTSTLLGWFLKLRYNSKLWIHIQDFEFDAALQTGLSNKKKDAFSLLFRLEKWLFSKADIASTISQSMLTKLKTKTKSENYFLPNWIDEEKINPKKSIQHKYLKSNKKKILYSGNIGAKQDWNTFFKFCKDLDDKEYEVIIVGDGAKKTWLLEQIRDIAITKYYPPVEYEDLSNLLCSADIHVLFQKNDVIDTVMPSKVLGMMASAKPSLIIGNQNSEVKAILESSQGGLYYSDYSNKILSDLNDLFKEDSKSIIMGENARNYVVHKFSKNIILNEMTLKINTL
jgi:colanic acid biosynthesis glycosyl transferase WcaI